MSTVSFDAALFAWHEDQPDSWALVALPPELDVEDVATFTIRVLD